MRIPERYVGKGALNTPEARKAMEAFKAGQGLYLHGITGSGKTHTAIAMMQEWFSTRIMLNGTGDIYPIVSSPVFLPAVELLHEIKASWDEHEARRSENENTILNRYSVRPLLVLDDLGAEKISDWSRQVIYLLLDRRYRDCKQTIITSNLTLQEIADVLEPRIASRLCEMGAVIDMGKKDWRVK